MVILLCLLCLSVGTCFGVAVAGWCFDAGEADKRAGLK